MTAQLELELVSSQSGQLFRASEAGVQPDNLGSMGFCINGVSQTPAQPNDKVLAFFPASIKNGTAYKTRFRVLTITQDPENDARNPGEVSNIEDSWWLPDICFKILNPEVLEQ